MLIHSIANAEIKKELANSILVCLINIKDLVSGTLHSRFVQSYLIMFDFWLWKCVVVASTVSL